MPAVCLLLLLLPMVSAQTYHWGPCPTPKVQPSFNLQQYLGRWYEIEKLPASFERGKCIEANYAVRKDGTIRVLNSQFYKDKVRVAEGTAVVQDVREMAKLGVSFSYFSITTYPALRGAGACPSCLGANAGYTLNKSPVYHRANTETNMHHVHTYGQFRVADKPNMHVFGAWEEAGVLGENPRRHRENMQTPHRKATNSQPSSFTPYSPYWVLTTDYTSFSVVYSCTDILRIFHVDYAWILSRSRFLPYETVQYAKELLYKEAIDVFRMKATNQMGCKDD